MFQKSQIIRFPLCFMQKSRMHYVFQCDLCRSHEYITFSMVIYAEVTNTWRFPRWFMRKSQIHEVFHGDVCRSHEYTTFSNVIYAESLPSHQDHAKWSCWMMRKLLYLQSSLRILTLKVFAQNLGGTIFVTFLEGSTPSREAPICSNHIFVASG